MITRELIENYIDKSLEKVRIDCEWYPLIYVKYKKYAHLYPDMIYAFCVALNHIAPQTNYYSVEQTITVTNACQAPLQSRSE